MVRRGDTDTIEAAYELMKRTANKREWKTWKYTTGGHVSPSILDMVPSDEREHRMIVEMYEVLISERVKEIDPDMWADQDTLNSDVRKKGLRIITHVHLPGRASGSLFVATEDWTSQDVYLCFHWGQEIMDSHHEGLLTEGLTARQVYDGLPNFVAREGEYVEARLSHIDAYEEDGVAPDID